MGSAWKQLPDDLSEPAKRLTEELRTVKDTTGLSLSELAARTHYSRASWERWLNGKRVVTEQALEALIGAVECDGPALRALWAETAAAGTAPGEAEPAGGDAADAVAETGAEAEAEVDAETGAETGAVPEASAAAPAGRRVRRPVALVAASVVVALLVALVGTRLVSSDGDDTTPTAATVPPSAPASGTSPASAPAAVPANPAPPVPACQALGCTHKDPKVTGCGGDARTLLTTNVGKVVVYLRYSQKCQAAWAAITEGQPGDQATITTSAGESETALIHWGYDNYSWMVNAADPAVTFQVCGQRKEPEGASCTPSTSDLARTVASTPIPPGPATPPPATTDPAQPAPASPSAPAAPSGQPSAASRPSSPGRSS
ncbi:DUF2690 domain-containing protein [Kitasatospora sp. NPDC001527]|uniref:helix-turn-helix domain-containing protein n=1 Tax=Kitasatospora sp. NPDC001527 TaxID=3154519 RepID=UPI00331E4D75